MGDWREVAIVSFAQTGPIGRESTRNETELLMPVIAEAFDQANIPAHRADFTVSGSSDYLSGLPFSFVFALDAVGAWPPLCESHLEMDGAWALYDAWVRLQHGDVDTALVYAFGKPSTGDIGAAQTLQLDPYYVAPLWPDPAALAALQARLFLDESGVGEEALAEVVLRSRRATRDASSAQAMYEPSIAALLAEPYVATPLRQHDLPTGSDGAVALVLAAGDTARRLCARPAWIRGIDHRIEPPSLGARPLARSLSTERAARAAAADAGFATHEVEIAELHAPFSHQELILRDALRLGDATAVNPSGGALASNPVMAAGLIRLGEAARQIHDGRARRALAHATSGPCLQQNLVALLEGGA